MDSLAAPGHARRLRPRRPFGNGASATTRRVRRVLIAAALLVLLPAAISYTAALLQASNSSTGIRSVEWLRDHGAAGLVAKVESIYSPPPAPAHGRPPLPPPPPPAPAPPHPPRPP